jgi:hypothetical protein
MKEKPPGVPKELCGGAKRDQHGALIVVAKSIELASNLRLTLEGLTKTGRPPIAPHRPGFDQRSWKVLAAYLIEERRLTEFLLGPELKPQHNSGELKYLHPDDICLDCFTPPSRRWRFTDMPKRRRLLWRARRINSRLTHFSWTLTEPDTRSDSGVWETHYLDDIRLGLSQFSEHLTSIGIPDADLLRYSVNEGPLDAAGA